MAIKNRAVSAEFNGLGLFAKSAKSFDLAFREIKDKNKIQKLWLRAKRKGHRLPPALLAIAATVSKNGSKHKLIGV